ncbi:Leucine rich repeat C-terminal domain [Mactra antiquata]
MGLSDTSRAVWMLLFISFLLFNKGYADPDPASTNHAPRPTQLSPRIKEGPQDGFFAKDLPATLNCKAEGLPPPAITWYQNGKQIQFDKDTLFNDNYRMMLDSGQLFFLRFIHTTNKSYVGTYYCKARNIHGSVVSREANVRVAVIKDEFRQQPVDTLRAIHSTVTLHCKPPRGEPDPDISWEHNGKAVMPSDRITLHDDGDLTISSLTVQDGGEYVCKASNTAGDRLSSPALLTVLEVPEIIQYPEDVSTDEGSTVEFHCQVAGDADVRWKKSGGSANKQKWRYLDDNTLRIENVEATDEGIYVCTAENAAGAVEAVAHLKIEYTPKFLVRPHNQAVAVGRTISLRCTAAGNPEPTIYWETASIKSLMFVKYQLGRISVAEDGTLRIERVQKSDEGEYSCLAYSSKGRAQASAVITVREDPDVIFPDIDLRPPPVIRFGPLNQTRAIDDVALLGCEATGDPKPLIRWYKNGKPVKETDARFTVLPSGMLQISSLKISDSGLYVCKASSETGETTMSAILKVEAQGREPMDPPPDLTMFPGAPEKPVVSDVSDTSIRLSWELLRDTGTSPVISYQVEYFAYGLAETWIISPESFTDTDVIINNLIPNTAYVFLVRARNQHGLGGHSPLSTIIRTLEKGHGYDSIPVVTLPDDEIKSRLKDILVQILRLEAVNSTSIRVSWMVKNELDVVTGFFIKYRQILNMGDRGNHRYGPMVTKRVHYRPLNHTIIGLEPYEYYEVCVMATSGDHSSPCSHSMKIQSGESVPSGPPVDIRVQSESDSEVIVTWSPPATENRKGEITGYMIKCTSEDGIHNCSKTTNSTTHRLHITNLIPGVNYNIQIAATTRVGVGKYSGSYSVGPDQNQITKEPWFIGMIGALGGILWLGLCIFTVWLCKSRKRRKKLKEQWYTGGPRPNDKTQERNGSICKGYGVKDGNFQDNNDCLPAEFNTLLQQSQQDSGGDEQSDNMYKCNHPEMKTFYQQSGPVTPYATTALLQAQAQAQAQNSRKQSGDQLFRPINQSCTQHSGGSGDSNTDKSITTDVSIEAHECKRSSASDCSHLSDENGILLKQQRKAGYRPVVGQGHNQPVVNWNDVLPPPPAHPPNDGDYLQDDQLYSEIPEDRAQSPMSPVSLAQMSACSCPVTHPHQVQNYNPGGYTDNCNRCQSLRSFDNRPYSPQQIMQLQRMNGIPPNMSRTLGAQPHQRGGGTPVYFHGYSQPWDSQPLPRAPFDYDYAQVPREDGYNYTEPIQDSFIDHVNIKPVESGQLYPGQQRDMSNIPGGPPGNYCEGPCRGQQMNNLNAMNSSYHRNNNSQIPYLEGYRIDSPPSSGNEYRVCNSGGSQSGSTAGSGVSAIKGRSASEGNDLRDGQIKVGTNDNQCRSAMYHSRSENSPPGQCMIDEGYTRNADSPLSEDPDYIEENNDDRINERDSMVANWESQEDCSDVHSSTSSPSDEGGDNQFLNEEDFASAVARAAELSGLTVVGTTVSDPSQKQGKNKKRQRHVRPPSPGYSTDSNYGTADIPHKPYPKSLRKKQLAEQGKLKKKGDYQSNKGDNSNVDQAEVTSPDAKNIIEHHSLYRNHKSPPGGRSGQEVQQNTGNSGNKLGMFSFGDDIPVV